MFFTIFSRSKNNINKNIFCLEYNYNSVFDIENNSISELDALDKIISI